MIPKKIHYCWFGGNKLPEFAQKCIASWRKYCSDYEIIEWNEKNFDLNQCRYVKEAYQEKKWAFVSDYARFWILFHFGGIYIDTDVEIIKPIDDIVQRGAYMGCESSLQGTNVKKSMRNLQYMVNPGLGIAAPERHPFFKEILDNYAKRSFYKPSGELDLSTVVQITTDALIRHGYKSNNKIQKVANIIIYPADYFCPKNYVTGVLRITQNTYSIHHYTASWQSHQEKKQFELLQKMNLIFGNVVGYKIWRGYTLPFRIYNKFRVLGLNGMIRFAMGKQSKMRKKSRQDL